MVEKVIAAVNEECSVLCRKSVRPVSLFRDVPIDDVDTFSWCKCIDEMKQKCPILLQLFTTIVSSSDHRNASKRGESHHPGICMATAMLLKERNREISGIQLFVSLVLFNSRVQKKVCVCV